MSNGRKLLFVISFLIIDLLLIGSILVIRDFTGKNILRSEVNALGELDFTKDVYNSEIKSKGELGTVEKAIKKYLDDYATEVQNSLRIRNDQTLNNMLATDNIVSDAPEFTESFNYIETVRNNFNYNVDLLMERVNEEAIKKYIYNYDVDDESIKLYNNLLLESNLIDKIGANQEGLAKKRIEINSYIDAIYDVLVFLKDNNYSYSIIDDKIIFNDTNVESRYYELLGEVKRIY